MESAKASAGKVRKEGFNCAETVLWGLCERWGMDAPVSAATGFGGGIAGTGATCGALTGAIIALGLKVGRTDPKDKQSARRCYALCERLLRKFEESMGTTLCKEILEKAQPKGSLCEKAVACAVDLASGVVGEEKDG